MGKTVEIAGVKDLLEKLSKMASIDPKQTQDVLVEGAKVFLAEVHTNAPVGETGNLKKSLKVKRGSRNRYYAMAFMANDRKIAPHTHLVEEGHHLVKGGKLGKGGHVVGRVKEHPFFWPAVERKLPEVQELVTESLQKLIEGAAK